MTAASVSLVSMERSYRDVAVEHRILPIDHFHFARAEHLTDLACDTHQGIFT